MCGPGVVYVGALCLHFVHWKFPFFCWLQNMQPEKVRHYLVKFLSRLGIVGKNKK